MAPALKLKQAAEARFRECFGDPEKQIPGTLQWSLQVSSGTGAVHVLLDTLRAAPIAWVFNPHQSSVHATTHHVLSNERAIDSAIAMIQSTLKNA